MGPSYAIFMKGSRKETFWKGFCQRVHPHPRPLPSRERENKKSLSHRGRGKKQREDTLLRASDNLVLAEAETGSFPDMDVFSKQNKGEKGVKVSTIGD